MVNRMSIREDVVVQGLMATPPTSVAAMTILGVPINDLILVGTGILLVLQIGYLLHKWVRLATSEGPVE